MIWLYSLNVEKQVALESFTVETSFKLALASTMNQHLVEQKYKMCRNIIPVQTSDTHLHVRQEKPALDFKMDFITTDW